MADENQEGVAAPAAEAAQQTAQPEGPAPAPSEPATSEPAPASAESETKDAAPAAEPSLLEKFDADQKKEAPAEEKKEPAAAEAPKPEEGAAPKPEEKAAEAPAEPAPPPPVEYQYQLPETLTMDDTLKGEVHSAFDEFRADPAKGAQKLIDLHERQMQDYAARVRQDQWDVFNATRKGWVTEVMADPELGGAGHQTAMAKVARMRDLLVSEADRPAFDEFLRVTGAGDHPQFLKLLHKAARHFDEPAPPPPNPKPTPNNGQRGGRRATLYDHPSSQNPGRS